MSDEIVFRSPEEVLRHAIEREADSSDYYHTAAMQTPDLRLRRFLLELAETERQHQRLLKERLEALESERFVESAITC